MLKYAFVFMVISISAIGAGDVFAQCFNINMNIEGTIDQHESCPNIDFVDNESCLVGNTLSSPSYVVRILTNKQVPRSSVIGMNFLEGVTTITSPNGSQLNGINSMISRAESDSQSGRLLDLFITTGGTGVFDNSAGEFVLDTVINNLNLTFTSVMKGQICLNVD